MNCMHLYGSGYIDPLRFDRYIGTYPGVGAYALDTTVMVEIPGATNNILAMKLVSVILSLKQTALHAWKLTILS